MAADPPGYKIVPFPKIRRLMVDGGRMARQKHIIHGLVEVDVTTPRRMIREYKARTGETISFTAFIIYCVGRAVGMNLHMQAHRTWGEKLVIHERVDVNTMFEVETAGQKIIRPHILRSANTRSLRELHDEIRDFQAHYEAGREGGLIDRFVRLPGFLRRWILAVILLDPRRHTDMNGTVSLTAVGMFGSGAGWAIPVSNHTLQITLGGIAEKPAFVEDRVERREFLCVTLSFDHDIVDGAPAARFTQRLKELIAGGAGLDEM